ncbi:hypothetical protein KCP69_06470 [Salmonella enterica subsp. enterica]|nr:hypothetical protein KCP69_06470 [Salmonella enterica subsp. enterica]
MSKNRRRNVAVKPAVRRRWYRRWAMRWHRTGSVFRRTPAAEVRTESMPDGDAKRPIRLSG